MDLKVSVDFVFRNLEGEWSIDKINGFIQESGIYSVIGDAESAEATAIEVVAPHNISMERPECQGCSSKGEGCYRSGMCPLV